MRKRRTGDGCFVGLIESGRKIGALFLWHHRQTWEKGQKVEKKALFCGA